MPEQTTVGDVLLNKVYLTEFVKRASERGVPVNSEADLANLLKIAQQISMAEQAKPVENPMLKRASEDLDRVLGAPARGNKTDPSTYLADPDVLAAARAAVTPE